jgi:hypothetical protein
MSQTSPFIQALNQHRAGKLQTPSVSMGKKEVDYFSYQMAVHKHNLSILSIGLKIRNVKISDIKKYYGFSGKGAKEILPQMEKLIKEYKEGKI